MNLIAKPLFDAALVPEITPLDTGAVIAIVADAAAVIAAVILMGRAMKKKKLLRRPKTAKSIHKGGTP